MLDGDGYNESLLRTAKADLITNPLCSGSPGSNHFEGNERFLEHQLERGVNPTGVLVVN